MNTKAPFYKMKNEVCLSLKRKEQSWTTTYIYIYIHIYIYGDMSYKKLEG